jgi:regulator of sigma E protease
MSWLLAFLGFAALILLHEFGHFAVAKAVGMRVERFSLFFPPIIGRIRRGETEYAIGAVPLGGYVRITGMNPHEEIPPDVAHRAYFRQPVWKRIAVIVAGPVVNIVLAFAILWGLFMTVDGGQIVKQINTIAEVEPGSPAAEALRPGDVIVAVDGERAAPGRLIYQLRQHGCAGAEVAGCRAAEPALVTVSRDGRERTLELRPFYDADPDIRAMRLGFAFENESKPVTPVNAAAASGEQMWTVTSTTVTKIVRIFDPEDRKELSSVVGGYETARQAIKLDGRAALYVLALISLSLGVINLFPFLPLDGGHIFWALAEKVSGRRIPVAVMERAGVIGFALVMVLFFVGLNNDIARLQGEGFSLR